MNNRPENSTLSIIQKPLGMLLGAALIFLVGCSKGQQASLDAAQFNQKMEATSGAVILDVRTPEEFSGGHLPNARNINWNDPGFKAQVEKLDKEKGVFVYCLSGGRSASAAKWMREAGFKEVYELDGGIMAWRNAGLQVTTPDEQRSPGMSVSDFLQLLDTQKLVLVDFYAPWCPPCKKMEPYLREIGQEMADSVAVVRINVDENVTLCTELGVSALPVLHIYKKKALVWNFTGYADKEKVLGALRSN